MEGRNSICVLNKWEENFVFSFKSGLYENWGIPCLCIMRELSISDHIDEKLNEIKSFSA